jgi:hypothetical protein
MNDRQIDILTAIWFYAAMHRDNIRVDDLPIGDVEWDEVERMVLGDLVLPEYWGEEVNLG